MYLRKNFCQEPTWIISILESMEKLLLNDQEVRSSGEEPHISDQLSFNEAPFCMSRVIRSKRNIQIAIERLLVRPGDELRGIIVVHTDCHV